MVEFAVEDDGYGFDAGAATRGNGFTNMRDRLGAFGGTVGITSNPGTGTRVIGRVPVREPRTTGRASGSAR